MNRNYFQTPPVVLNLIIINVLIFMATALLPKAGNTIMEYCALSLGTPFFHVYQFITYMFLHANFEHIFFNMFALWMFGRTLEYELGSQRFLTFYMVCGVGAALIQYLTALAFGELPLLLVSASGAVMGLLLGQCIGRWANFINREAFGAETTLPWRMQLTTVTGQLVEVHPTFLYESLWNLAGLLLIIFVENAFKHGVSYAAPSFIDIKVTVTQEMLQFKCRNSRQEQKPDEKKKKGGVGLANARRRLDLLFHDKYSLEIKEDNKEYDVQLEIPLSKNNS